MPSACVEALLAVCLQWPMRPWTGAPRFTLAMEKRLDSPSHPCVLLSPTPPPCSPRLLPLPRVDVSSMTRLSSFLPRSLS